MSEREQEIEAAVCGAGALIAALLKAGPLNSEQIGLIVWAAVRVKVPNAAAFEVRQATSRICEDLERPHAGN